jgi:hypothetical protein
MYIELVWVLSLIIRVIKGTKHNERLLADTQDINNEFYVAYDSKSSHISQDNIKISLYGDFIHAQDIKMEKGTQSALCQDMKP